MFIIKRLDDSWKIYHVTRHIDNVVYSQRATVEDLLELYRQLVVAYDENEEISVLKTITTDLSRTEMQQLIAAVDLWLFDGIEANAIALA